MVNTMSGSGVDQPAVNQPGREPHQAQMDLALQQFLEAQTQLLQNLTNTVTNLQGQVNNPPVQQPAPRKKHREFMSHHPPVFTHAADPLEAEDWLKTVLKMLTTCQCDDREKVLYAAG
jgi:hypothetical protein